MGAAGLLREVAGHWVLQVGLETLETGVPESMRQMLVQQFEGLSRRRGDAGGASVVGVDATAAVAAGVERL